MLHPYVQGSTALYACSLVACLPACLLGHIIRKPVSDSPCLFFIMFSNKADAPA